MRALPKNTQCKQSFILKSIPQTDDLARFGRCLHKTIEIINFWQSYILDKVFDSVKGWECQNMLTISKLIAQQALLRQESRGVHFRSDFPEPNEILCHHLDITSN